MKLSTRLKTLSNCIKPTHTLIDIGCDHGKLCIDVIKRNLALNAVGIDNKTGPLARCQENIDKYKLNNRIKCLLSNGLDKYTGPADTIVIAGMGGELMIEIIKNHLHLFHQAKQILLEPHSKLFELKEFLNHNHFTINKHTIVKDKKLYVILDVEKKQEFTPCSIYLMDNVNDLSLYYQWLSQWIHHYTAIGKKHDPITKCLNQEYVRLTPLV